MKSFADILEQATRAWTAFARPERPRFVVGISTCSMVAGSMQTLERLKGEIEARHLAAGIGIVGCAGLCFAEPLVDVIWPGGRRVRYGRVTEDLVPQFLEDILSGRERADLALGVVEPGDDAAVDSTLPMLDGLPYMQAQQRIVMARFGLIDPVNVDHYIATGGYASFINVLTTMGPDQLIEVVKASNIRGRGGAYYPAGRKWEQCRAAKGYPKYVICNADEGVPGTFVDRVVLEGNAHAVLEGMLLAAYAVGSDSGFIYVRGEYEFAAQVMSEAIRQARTRGLLGKDILESGFNFDVQLRRGSGCYVAGESSAMMSSIEGMRAMPRLKRPRSVEKGLWARPTTMNNVETLASIPAIVRMGGKEYGAIGTGRSSGTKLYSVSGRVERTVVVEVPFGSTIRRMLEECAGGVEAGHRFKAVQMDGSIGPMLPANWLDKPLDIDTFKKEGGTVGSGGISVMDERSCVVDQARFSLRFLSEESCDRCTTCRVGTRRLRDYLHHFTRGHGRLIDLEYILALDKMLVANSQCGLGQAAGDPARSAIQFFREEFEAHIVQQRCPALVCPDLIRYRLHPEKCGDCVACAASCPTGAIVGADQMTIVDERCIRCDICREVCPQGAITVEARPQPEVPPVEEDLLTPLGVPS